MLLREEYRTGNMTLTDMLNPVALPGKMVGEPLSEILEVGLHPLKFKRLKCPCVQLTCARCSRGVDATA